MSKRHASVFAGCVGGTESVILSAHAESSILSVGGTESMMLSACAESMIVSVLLAESMILSAPFDCVITLIAARWAVTKKTIIGDTDDCRFTNLVTSASTAAKIGLPP